MGLQQLKFEQGLNEATNSDSVPQERREQIKQELRQKIHETLQAAKNALPGESVNQVRTHLNAIQTYCQLVSKGFVVVEEEITCNQHDLGGSTEDTATLFRGPNEDASVAICVTRKGSLLYRNSCPWTIYRNAGDIKPLHPLSL